MPSWKSDRVSDAIHSLSVDAPQLSDFVKMLEDQLESCNSWIISTVSGNTPSVKKQCWCSQHLDQLVYCVGSSQNASSLSGFSIACSTYFSYCLFDSSLYFYWGWAGKFLNIRCTNWWFERQARESEKVFHGWFARITIL